jgi:PAS domain S-box-containing protein
MAKTKILVVEDELEVGDLIQKCLERSGFEVVAVVPTAEEALAAARAKAPDLVLMDIVIPGEMDGVDAAAKLRFDQGIPVIFLTGSVDEHTLERAKHTEPIGYLLKPFDPEVLHTTIKSSLYQYQASIKRAQISLQHAEEKYREMFENLPLGMYQTTPSGGLLNANPSMARILGYQTPDDLLAATTDLAKDVYEAPSSRQELIRQLAAHDTISDFETRVRRRDGSLIWVSINARVIRDREGHEQYYEGIIQDITERKLAEDALAKSERKYRLLFETSRDAIMTLFPPDWTFTTANAATLDMFGAESERAFTTLGPGSVSPERQPSGELSSVKVERMVAAAMEEGSHFFEWTHKKISGELFPATVLLTRVEFEGKRGLQATVRNITVQKRAENEIRESESRLTCVVNAAQDGIIMIDDDDRVTLWSPAAERITGYAAAEAVGTTLHHMLAPSRLQPAQHQAFQAWRQTGCGNAIGKTVEVPCLRKDGIEVPVELSLSSVQLNGRWTAVGIIRDITERKRVETQRDRMEVMLHQSQKLESIGQLAAGIAHEINTPIQYVGDNTRFFKDAFTDVQHALKAYRRLLDTCKQGPVPDEILLDVDSTVRESDLDYLSLEIPKAIAQTLEGVDRVTTIVRAMKDFSHPGIKEKIPTNIHQAIESTLIVCRHEYKYVADVTIDFDASMPPVPCFPGDFNQVIMNLIVNASHAIAGKLGPKADSKGKISVVTRHDDSWAEIRIADTGTGIPEEIRSKIFDPFFTTKEVGKGTGQGLAICHAVVVDMHGGTITFDTQIGKGTIFIIRLPLDNSGQKSEAA